MTQKDVNTEAEEYFTLGQLSSHRENHQDAIKAYSKAAELYPKGLKKALAHNEAAIAYSLKFSEDIDQTDLAQKAIKHYRQAVDMYTEILAESETPSFDVDDLGKAYCFMGVAYCDVGDFETGIGCHEKAMEYCSPANLALVYSELSDIYKYKKDHDKAEDYFNKAKALAI